MSDFISKKIPLEETLGEQLRRRRHYKNLKIATVAKILKIRPEYLIALEEERFEDLPSGLYGKNFLKQYAVFLKLPETESLTYWEKQLATDNQQNPFSQKIVKSRKFIVFPKIVRNILIALLVLACFLYLIFYFKNITSPPLLIINQPSKNLLTADNFLIIHGQTDPSAEVTINGQNIINFHHGYFSQKINLKQGLNNLVIKAKKKYSQDRIVTREILVK